VIRRGDIWWASVDDARVSDSLRPVLIVSSDAFNRSQIPTVLALAISSDLRLAEAPGNVPLHTAESRLPTDAVINVAAVSTLAKSDLEEWLARVGANVMRLIEAGLRLTLGLDIPAAERCR
jgi:mRNA interferase MazF